MSDKILEALIKAEASEDVIQEYKKLKNHDSNKANRPLEPLKMNEDSVKPKRKCTEKQLAALKAGREKRRKLKE